LFDLSGSRALLTGGAGLSSAMAEGLRAAGAQVAIIGPTAG
jgi:NAD(P)-dependent dehydrogenase (short-subunit alcohol dehydrogenase family)